MPQPVRHRSNLISLIFRSLLIGNILVFILAAIWIFVVSNTYDIYILGTISSACLIAAVGMLLIYRWQRLGLAVVVGAYVCAWSIFIAYPQKDNFLYGFVSVIWNYFPYISASIIVLISFLLFAIKDGVVKKNCWSQMSNGADVKHFRHIYQLTTIVLLILGGLIIYMPTTKVPVHKEEKAEKPEPTTKTPTVAKRSRTLSLLDSADITLAEVVSIEQMIEQMGDSISYGQKAKYESRIFALKHLLLSGIMDEVHDANNIVNIAKIHSGEFSEFQQKILDWYLELPDEKKQCWNQCPAAISLQDFKLKLTEILDTKNSKDNSVKSNQ